MIFGVAGFTYSGTVYLYRKDVQGNVIAIFNSNGEIVARYFYDAWGNHVVVDNSGATIVGTSHIGHLNPFRYRGYYYDVETGLYYLKERYYDPVVGRFISMDDIAYLNPEVINDLNLYAYCGNNPVTRNDPNGTTSNQSVGVNFGALFNYEGYVWRGRYVPGGIQYGTNNWGYWGVVLRYAAETILSAFELNLIGYEFRILDATHSGFSLVAAGVDMIDARMYTGTTDYMGLKVGSLDLSIIDIVPEESNYTILEAQATALTVGAYSEYASVEVLVGSIGAVVKFENGELTLGFSFGWGINLSIKFW